MPSTPVSLSHCDSYASPRLGQILMETLDQAKLPPVRGKKVLVKPNLLMNRELACTNPLVVSLTCKYLLDKGASIIVSDSPGFGKAKAVATQIGLLDSLKPLGLTITPFKNFKNISLSRGQRIKIAIEALETDEIYSIARVKAHSQMRMTLCVKNCFGVVPGFHKALVHARYGDSTGLFAETIMEIFTSLPPVRGVLDGIIAMHVTGPSKGEPYELKLLGASAMASQLDLALLEALNIPQSSVPLCALTVKTPLNFPLKTPQDWNVKNFIVPDKLKPASFDPKTLARSLWKRFWKSIAG